LGNVQKSTHDLYKKLDLAQGPTSQDALTILIILGIFGFFLYLAKLGLGFWAFIDALPTATPLKRPEHSSPVFRQKGDNEHHETTGSKNPLQYALA
jgi:hypothetical protein